MNKLDPARKGIVYGMLTQDEVLLLHEAPIDTIKAISENAEWQDIHGKHFCYGCAYWTDWERGMQPDVTKTNRGFCKIEVTDTRGCICRIQRSSSVEDDAVWIFCDDPHGVYRDEDPSPHLNAEQARAVARALLAFADGKDEKEVKDVQA